MPAEQVAARSLAIHARNRLEFGGEGRCSQVALVTYLFAAMASAFALAHVFGHGVPAAETQRAPLANVEAKSAAIAATLASECPLEAVSDALAEDRCRRGLHSSAVLRPSLGPLVLWGRHGLDRPRPLAEAELIQIGPATLKGTYLPLFAFDGRSRVTWSATDGLWRVELAARLRERHGSEAVTSPLRSEDELRSGLEHTEAIVMWLEADARSIFAVMVAARDRR